MTIADKLTLLASSKEALRVKLGLPKNLPFSEYYKHSYPFNPLSLFEGGKQGVWYDPSDITTLFQDVAGTVPVTKDGDPVALILDKSQGLKLSPNILPNSDFSDGLTGWRVGFPSVVSATMVDGKCVLEHIGTRVGAALGLEPTLNFEVGKTYKLIVDVENTGDSTLDMGIYVFQDTTQTTLKVSGRDTIMRVFTAETSSMKIRIGFDLTSTMPPTNSKLIIHSIKAQELSGNHAKQTESASRPVYKTDGELHWLEFDGVDDNLLITKMPRKNGMYVAAGALTESTANQAIIGGLSNSRVLYASGANNLTFYTPDNNTNNVWSSYVNGVVRSTPEKRAAMNPLLFLSKYAVIAISDAAMLNATFDTVYIGSMGDGTYFGGNITSIVLAESVSEETQGEVTSYMANKSGVTL